MVTGARAVPAAARFLPQRVYYGWWVAVGCAALMFVGVGVGYYGLAVLLRPLRDAHGWSNSAVSGATALYFAASGVAGAVAGPHIDRRGPMPFMVAGIVAIALSVAVTGYVDSLWQLYAAYVVLAAGFGMATSVAINAVMTRWFVARRAQAMSIASTGVSVGGVVLVPVGTWLIDRGGLELATPLLGLLVLVVALPVLAFVIVPDPQAMGLGPDGPGTAERRLRVRAPSRASQHRQWRRAEAARTTSFWAILVGFLLVLTAQTGFVIHQISFLEDRLGSRSAAAITLSVTAFGSIVARLVVGTFADAVDKRWLTVGLLALQGSAVLALLATESTVATYALTLVFGFTIGNIYMMQSLLVGEIFGMASFGTVFGLVSLASQAGSGLGPLFVGWLDDVTGSYRLPLTLTAVATYLAAAVVVFARPVEEGEEVSMTAAGLEARAPAPWDPPSSPA